MFIENEIINLFSSVRAKCETKRYKHSIPTKSTPNARMAFGGAKELGCLHCYKHIVPTGLKSMSHSQKTPKLTLMVRLGNRTYRP